MSANFFKLEVEWLSSWRVVSCVSLVLLLANSSDTQWFIFFAVSIVMLLADLIFVYLEKRTCLSIK